MYRTSYFELWSAVSNSHFCICSGRMILVNFERYFVGCESRPRLANFQHTLEPPPWVMENTLGRKRYSDRWHNKARRTSKKVTNSKNLTATFHDNWLTLQTKLPSITYVNDTCTHVVPTAHLSKLTNGNRSPVCFVLFVRSRCIAFNIKMRDSDERLWMNFKWTEEMCLYTVDAVRVSNKNLLSTLLSRHDVLKTVEQWGW